MIELTDQPLDFQALTERVRSDAAGAVVVFLGTVREFTRGIQTKALEYTAYHEMARSSLEQLETEARQRFPVIEVGILHRVGALDLGDVSVAIAVSTPHRAEAFAAGQWLIDTLKLRVPIWKKECFSDGREEWQHPGMPTDSEPGLCPPSDDAPALHTAPEVLRSPLPAGDQTA
jgi:molybdopterin synthase catalytic subunit